MGTEKKRIILLLNKYLERDDIRDIEGLSVDGIVRGKQQHAAVEQVEHDLGACVARSGIQAGKGLVQNHRVAWAQQGSGNLDATALPAPISALCAKRQCPAHAITWTGHCSRHAVSGSFVPATFCL